MVLIFSWTFRKHFEQIKYHYVAWDHSWDFEVAGSNKFLFSSCFLCILCHSLVAKVIQSNLAIRNGLIRNKLVLRNHFLWPICHLLHKDKELLALRNNFRVTKKFLIAKFDCTIFPKLVSPETNYFWDHKFAQTEITLTKT